MIQTSSISNYNQQTNTYVKKCGYFLSILDKDSFIKLGGINIKNTDIYIIKKEYDGSPTGESCATIGLNKKDILIAIKDPDNNEILNILRKTDELGYIESIDKLSINYISIIVEYFKEIINELPDNILLLLNIEPIGQTKRQLKFYPNPNVCIPGGNMEDVDQFDFEKCAIREFEEETNIKIKSYRVISKHKIPVIKLFYNEIKKNFEDEKYVYKNNSNFRKKYVKKYVKVEKMYFLVRITI